MEQVEFEYRLHAYTLQPGDRTIYRFGFMLLNHPLGVTAFDTVDSPAIHIHGMPVQEIDSMLGGMNRNLISGTGSATYVVLIDFRDPFNVMLIPVQDIADPNKKRIAELSSIYHEDVYTLAVMVLAVQKLWRDNEDIAGALRNMLHAPELLYKDVTA